MSTLTAVALRGQTWTLAHVGDTRAYLLRGTSTETRECRRLTQDHALDHPDLRSRLTRAMGLDDAVRVDYLQGDLHVGDSFVLLSDGAWGKLSEARIRALASTRKVSSTLALSTLVTLFLPPFSPRLRAA